MSCVGAIALCALSACDGAAEHADPSRSASDTAQTLPAAAAPSNTRVALDSTWIVVARPTIIAFHPLATNEQLEADEGLAVALDDLAYHLGTAMDSLVAYGVVVHYQPGDTVKLRAGGAPYVFARNRDSAHVGYVFADSAGRRAVVYGVRSHLDLIGYAKAFVRTGTLPPDP